jgi:hypothetical protein
VVDKETIETVANARTEDTPEEQARKLGVFAKALTALVRFVKWTVIDVITKAVVLGVTAVRDGLVWIISVGRG